VLVIVVFLFVKPGHRFVEPRLLWIILDSAFEEIPADREKFPLRLEAKSEARLASSM